MLFFFCSDVAILAIRQGATALVEQLTRWSLEFIKNRVKKNKTLLFFLSLSFDLINYNLTSNKNHTKMKKMNVVQTSYGFRPNIH